MAPMLAGLAIAAGGFVVVRVLAREWERVNRILDDVRPEADVAEPPRAMPTLKRDPRTGVWRPEDR